jgi:dephospho-CoA kinase
MEAKENLAKSTNQQLDNTFSLADKIVDNGGTLEELQSKVDKLLQEIRSEKSNS